MALLQETCQKKYYKAKYLFCKKAWKGRITIIGQNVEDVDKRGVRYSRVSRKSTISLVRRETPDQTHSPGGRSGLPRTPTALSPATPASVNLHSQRPLPKRWIAAITNGSNNEDITRGRDRVAKCTVLRVHCRTPPATC